MLAGLLFAGPVTFYIEDDLVYNISIIVTYRLELRCVIAVVRHGDRTPKQKMKMVVTHERLVI